MADTEPRRIVQIAISEAGAENGYSRSVLALAHDGTLWECSPSDWHKEGGVKWHELPPLPPREKTELDNLPF